MAFTPICIGVVVWAALDLNGSYPTVKPAVPHGWQAVLGIYASFSVPNSWVLEQSMSDESADVYYSGRAGAAGESVLEADAAPSPTRGFPAVLATYLGGQYAVQSVEPVKLGNASVAWRYRFRLTGGGTGLGVLAWVKATQTQVWLVAAPATALANRVLSTLRLAT
jgi:hypothetical protein